MDKQIIEQTDSLDFLRKELKDIKAGQDILKSSRELVELKIRNRTGQDQKLAEMRAIVIQLNKQPKMQIVEPINVDDLLDIQRLDNFEGQDWKAEHKDINRKLEQELALE